MSYTIDDAWAALEMLSQRRARAEQVNLEAEKVENWRDWVGLIAPKWTWADFAPHQVALLDWAWNVADDQTLARAFAALWARGHAKSTLAEIICVMLGARRKRKYALYVCRTQDLANDHLRNINGLLESAEMAEYFPAMAERQVTKYGHSRGWKIDRLSTASGFTIDALGLDTAARGAKLDESRPDLIIIDDIDHEHDSELAVTKKLETLTGSVLMAGSTDVIVLFCQNLIHRGSIASMLYEGTTDMLTGAAVSDPVPALVPGPHPDDPAADWVVGIEFDEDAQPPRFKVTQGTPTWPSGMGIEECEEKINLVGPTSFRRESLHDVDIGADGLWSGGLIRYANKPCPTVIECAVGVDPPAGKQGTCGIITGALVDYSTHADTLEIIRQVTQAATSNEADEEALLTLAAATNNLGVEVYDDWSTTGGAGVWPSQVITALRDIEEQTGIAGFITAEINNGGDMIKRLMTSIDPLLEVREVRAGKGEDKTQRALPVVSAYRWRRVMHLVELEDLELQQRTWNQRTSGYSPDRMDALVWLVTGWLPLLEMADQMALRGSETASPRTTTSGRLGVRGTSVGQGSFLRPGRPAGQRLGVQNRRRPS